MKSDCGILYALFPDIEKESLPAFAAECRVASVAVNEKTGRLRLGLDFHQMPFCRKDIEKLKHTLMDAYRLSSVEVSFCCALSEGYIASLREEIPSLMPGIGGFLAGSRWKLAEDTLEIIVRTGVSDLVDDLRASLERRIYDETGRHLSVRIIPCSVEEAAQAESEFAALRTEDLRRIAEETAKEAASAPHSPKRTAPPAEHGRFKRPKAAKIDPENVLLGKLTEEPSVPMRDISAESGRVTVEGEIFFVEVRDIPARQLKVVSFDMTDHTSSVRVVKVMDAEKADPLESALKKGLCVTVQGTAGYSKFEKDTIITPFAIVKTSRAEKQDLAETKRVELHLHTNMSSMDGVTSASDYIARAAAWGHPAIAITDHGVVQAYPEAMKAAKKHGMKIIYGVEGYLVDDLRRQPGDVAAVDGLGDQPIEDEIVVFDLETTGLKPERCAITEIAAIKIKNGGIGESFHTYVNPYQPIPPEITQLTGISDETVKDAPGIKSALPAFLEFVGESPLCAHNASFDMSFIRTACQKCGISHAFTSIDTLAISRAMLPNMKKHRLNDVAEAVGAGGFEHHRADEDTRVLAEIMLVFLRRMKEELGISRLREMNGALGRMAGGVAKDAKRRHVLILVQKQEGVRNLYRLISDAHLKYFKTRPIIPASLLARHREGLLVGSACEAGELFSALVEGVSDSELLQIASFYDLIEIQPIGNNAFLVEQGKVKGEEGLRTLNRRLVAIADKLKKPVIATGDVHFLDPRDEVFRRILMAGQGFADADRQAPLYFRTTEEMLKEFAYFGDRAYEFVVGNPQKIAESCEDVLPIPKSDKPFSPELPGSKQELNELTYGKAKRLYGDPLPEIVSTRIEKELVPIIENGYDVMYMIAQKLVQRSLECGYLVGSRGSVGSSIVAYMSGITEVNALPPHYRCPQCKHSDFEAGKDYHCGADMPDAVCPICGAQYEKDGFDIPFATFLGFNADKTPDIDLNFSGDYQARAHRHTMELFGESHVFRAGTIGTVAEKTAYGYVRKYMDERGLYVSKAEINRLVQGCTGIKRTTGQHPGGLIVVPKDRDILEFTPVQHPADDTRSETITTHFEYHSIDTLLLKLDLLAHDNPTTIRHLEDLTGVDATQIPFDDPETMSLFTSTKALGFEKDEVLGDIGAAAIPEFGTKFVRGMLEDTMPTTFDELVRISGLSHGTDVWVGNAQDLVRGGTATLGEVICARDDIMLYLIGMGLAPKISFTIMESVRKGRGLKPEWEEDMRSHAVPEWYIESCKKIKYMFPKAHAVAYVMMAFRIAWFKVHRPLAFYCAYFSNRISSFDLEAALGGKEVVRARMKAISGNPEATAAEKETLITLEICYEMALRGLNFAPLDLYRSHPTQFIMEENALRPPLTAIPGLGETAALSIAEEREKEPFLSVDEITLRCAKVSRAICEMLRTYGALGDLPESAQVSLF